MAASGLREPVRRKIPSTTVVPLPSASQQEGGFYPHLDVSVKSCRQNGASPVPHCQAASPGFVSGNTVIEEFYSAEFNMMFL